MLSSRKQDRAFSGALESILFALLLFLACGNFAAIFHVNGQRRAEDSQAAGATHHRDTRTRCRVCSHWT